MVLVTPEVTQVEQEIASDLLIHLIELILAKVALEIGPPGPHRILAFAAAILMESDQALTARSHFVKAGQAHGGLVGTLARYLREEFEWTGERMVELPALSPVFAIKL